MEVAWALQGHYDCCIDLAGRLGRFALAFALGRTCSYLSPNVEKTLLRSRGAVTSSSERTSHEYGCGEMVQ